MTKTMQSQKQSQKVIVKKITEDDELANCAAVLNEIIKYECVYQAPNERDFKRFTQLIETNQMHHLFEIGPRKINCVNGSQIRINELIVH